MRKSITINIPEPCHEDWNKMTLKAQGKYCATCSKTVFDFTNKTDEQIVKTFETENNLCGRFNKQQLNRELVLARKSKNNYLSLAASGLFAFMALGNQDSFAQEKPKTEKTEPIRFQRQIVGKFDVSVLSEKIIHGIVTSADDNAVLPEVIVKIKGSSKSTQTNFDGKFSLRAKVGDIIVFEFIGHERKEIIIDKSLKSNISVQLEAELMGEIVVMDHSSIRSIKAQERKAKREAIKNGEHQRTVLGKFFYSIKRLFSKR